MIHTFFEAEVNPRMKVGEYVVYFANIKGKIVLIEFSPFLRTTGAGVLSWDNYVDKLRHGSGKLKVASKSNPDADMIAHSFEEHWEDTIDYRDNYVKESCSEKTVEPLKKSSVYVCSVLKKGFFWNLMYLSFGEFIGEGVLSSYSVLVDDVGMGWTVETAGGK